MPGTPARAGGVIAGSGVLANIVAGAGLAVLAGGAVLTGAAVLAGTATPALAAQVPVTIDPATAMPGLPVTGTIKCNSGAKSATLYGKELGLNGPVSMKSARDNVFAVTVSLPTGLAPGVYTVVAGCENGDYGTTTLTVQGAPTPPPPTPRPTYRPRPRPRPCPCKPTWYPTAAPFTGDGSTSFPGGGAGIATVAGVGLVGVGGATGVAAVRRLRRSQR
jgi:hypothetical protein